MVNFRELGNPGEFWEYFKEISKIPRCSGNEGQIRTYVKNQAEKFNYQTKVDKAGNLLVSIPPKNGGNSIVILQSHLDMVCEKNENTLHDFSKDPLKLKVIEINGKQWITAEETTLGADNATGMAYQLTLMKKISSGELEFGSLGLDLLFTVKEEVGLIGAFQIEEGLIRGDTLINLDSGRDDSITIGCATGLITTVNVKLGFIQINPEDEELEPIKILVTGLIGGHSGADIHRGRANAIKLMAKILWKLNDRYSINVQSINGGKEHNAIPRESNSILYVRKNDLSDIMDYVNALATEVKSEFTGVDDNIEISIQKLNVFGDTNVFSEAFQNKILSILYLMPHGPISMHPHTKDLVRTSNNLASIVTNKYQLKILIGLRSFNGFSNKVTAEKIASLFKIANLTVRLKTQGSEGDWKPDFSTNLLKIAREAYKELFNMEVSAQGRHIGLEPRAFKLKIPELEAICIGPNLSGAHSPDEQLDIKSVEKIWKFLIQLLNKLT
ncbi:MAG: beta-Ala-His dipeptidase [Promethearchaeota archaeon]